MPSWTAMRPSTATQDCASSRRAEDEWLSGWDPTPGIVSVWAENDGRAFVWQRTAETNALVKEEVRFRPWLLLDRLDDLRHLGVQFGPEGSNAMVTYRELDCPGALRYLVSSDDGKTLVAAVLAGATRRLGRRVNRLQELGKSAVFALPPEEQYLVATGRTYFRDLSFNQLRRMQFDLETTGLDPERDRIFLIAIRDPTTFETLSCRRGDVPPASAGIQQAAAPSAPRCQKTKPARHR